ncbi:MAG: TadE/TadG family type IV pilus assembly protein [Pseudomonadota bacterium]
MMKLLSRFRTDQQGSFSVETVIIFPLLAWVLVFVLVAWDGYKLKGAATNATYTIGDLISRQSSVDEDFIKGMERIFTRISQRADATDIRVTVVMLRARQNQDPVLEVVWSDSTGTLEEHTTVDTFRDKVPLMAPGSSLIYVETTASWTPPLRLQAFEGHKFTTNAFFSPRYLALLPHLDRSTDELT